MAPPRRPYVARTKADSGAVSDSGAIRSRKVRGFNGEGRRRARFASNPLILRGARPPLRAGMKQAGKIRPKRPFAPRRDSFCGIRAAKSFMKARGADRSKNFRPPQMPEPLA
jgi:hypothetical protein